MSFNLLYLSPSFRDFPCIRYVGSSGIIQGFLENLLGCPSSGYRSLSKLDALLLSSEPINYLIKAACNYIPQQDGFKGASPTVLNRLDAAGECQASSYCSLSESCGEGGPHLLADTQAMAFASLLMAICDWRREDTRRAAFSNPVQVPWTNFESSV